MGENLETRGNLMCQEKRKTFKGETESTVHETKQSTCSVWRTAANAISMTLPQDRCHSYLETKHARF